MDNVFADLIFVVTLGSIFWFFAVCIVAALSIVGLAVIDKHHHIADAENPDKLNRTFWVAFYGAGGPVTWLVVLKRVICRQPVIDIPREP